MMNRETLLQHSIRTYTWGKRRVIGCGECLASPIFIWAFPLTMQER